MIWNYFWYLTPFVANSSQYLGCEHNKREEVEEVDKKDVRVKEQNQEQNIFKQQFDVHLLKKHQQPKKKLWKPQQDDALYELGYGEQDWVEISKKFEGSSPESCQRRFQRVKKIRVRWPKEIDEEIKYLFEVCNLDWCQVQRKIKNYSFKYKDYTVKMVRQRYKNYLRPELNKRPWSIRDDQHLMGLIEEHNLCWPQITKQITDRSEIDIRNRYYGILEPLQRKALNQTKSLMKKKKKGQELQRM